MIKPSSILYIIDNCGGRRAQCIKLLNKSPLGYSSVGDLILVSLKSYRRLIKKKKVKKNSIYLALIVSTKKSVNRLNGSSISCLENNIVLLNKDKVLIGKRIRGTVFSELRYKGYLRIASIAENII